MNTENLKWYRLVAMDESEAYLCTSTSTITYNANNGIDDPLTEGPYISGKTVRLSQGNIFTSPDGSSFDSWNTAADGSGDSYNASQVGALSRRTNPRPKPKIPINTAAFRADI